MNNHLNLPQDSLLEYVGSMDQLAGVRRFHLSEGKAKGVEAIHVETGSGFTFAILVDRTLDLADVSYCGKSLCWRSSAGIVAPSYYERRGSGWLRGFGGGMLVTCGLRNVGPAQEEGWEMFGLHGEISFTPATEVHTSSKWLGSNYQIEVSGLVREGYPFGSNLSMRRTWKTQLGATWVELEDVVTNEGFRPEIHMQLYHWNFGFPLLNANSRLCLTTDLVTPRDEAARQGLEQWTRLAPPTSGFDEQVFFHSYGGDLPEFSSALLVSDLSEQNLGVELSYHTQALPYLVQWKLCGKGEYVLGLEPGNCLVEGRQWHRQQHLPLLEPGEARTFRLRLSVLTTAEEVANCIPKYPVR